MSVDYDIVIIGGSLAGRYAALTATQMGATVALVEPKHGGSLIEHYVLSEIAKRFHQINLADQFGINTLRASNAEKCQVTVSWQEVMLYAQSVGEVIEQKYSPPLIASQGVDVILGDGQFQESPRLAFTVNNRQLTGRSYLLATGSRPAIPEIEGLQATGYVTLTNITQSLSQLAPPKSWVIVGGVPQSIELAQTLVRMGCEVTLVVERRYIISHIDPEIALLLQAQLEVEGVRLLTQTEITQVRLIEGKKWVQAGDKAIEADEIVVACAQQPNIESLNLAAVGVKWRDSKLLVNKKLQTTNRRIYACGDAIGGYDLPNIANYEARVAVDNALFFAREQVNYRSLPWSVFTQPSLAQVGLTEAQAIRHYGADEVMVLRQYFKSLALAQITSETTGVCKLIVLRNGEILGCSLLGAESGEFINLIALAIAKNIRVKDLGKLSPVYPSFCEIVTETARLWSQQKLKDNLAKQDFLASFFLLRRDWNL